MSTLIKTIGRSATKGCNSGRFYPPVDVKIDGQNRIHLVDQALENNLSFWPDEAAELANAILKAAYQNA